MAYRAEEKKRAEEAKAKASAAPKEPARESTAKPGGPGIGKRKDREREAKSPSEVGASSEVEEVQEPPQKKKRSLTLRVPTDVVARPKGVPYLQYVLQVVAAQKEEDKVRAPPELGGTDTPRSARRVGSARPRASSLRGAR